MKKGEPYVFLGLDSVMNWTSLPLLHDKLHIAIGGEEDDYSIRNGHACIGNECS